MAQKTLDQLDPNNAPALTDLFPTLPVGAPKLLKVTLAQLAGVLGVGSVPVIASEAIAGNSFVNVYDNAGTPNMRNAVATDPTKFANGFVKNAVAMNATGQFFGLGLCPVAVPTTSSAAWLSDVTPGGWRATPPPRTAGYIWQSLGPAIEGEGIFFSFSSQLVMI